MTIFHAIMPPLTTLPEPQEIFKKDPSVPANHHAAEVENLSDDQLLTTIRQLSSTNPSQKARKLAALDEAEHRGLLKQ